MQADAALLVQAPNRLSERLKPGAFAISVVSPAKAASNFQILRAYNFEVRDTIAVLHKNKVSLAIISMKPVAKNFANNAIEHGLAGLNIDRCRIESKNRPLLAPDPKATETNTYAGRIGNGGLGKGLDGGSKAVGTTNQGRWPANVVAVDPNREIADRLDAFSGVTKSPKSYVRNSATYNKNSYSKGIGEPAGILSIHYGDEGGASRFFKIAEHRGQLFSYLLDLLMPPNENAMVLCDHDSERKVAESKNWSVAYDG